jgi:hypothetical protein
MINHRETEIRNMATELVLKTYEADMCAKIEGTKLSEDIVDLSFEVSSAIAKAFSSLQDIDFERQMLQALRFMEKITGLTNLVKGSVQKGWLSSLKKTVDTLQIEIEACILSVQALSKDELSPKLEKACI